MSSSSRTKAETPSSNPTSLLWELRAFFSHRPEGDGLGLGHTPFLRAVFGAVQLGSRKMVPSEEKS